VDKSNREAEWNVGWFETWNEETTYAWGAEVGEMNWTQWSEGWMRSEARTASPET